MNPTSATLPAQTARTRPFFTTSPAATNGSIHAHDTAYATTTKDASRVRLITPAIGSSVLVRPGV